ncbi:MAG: hypothetical protein LBS97_00275 [Treponema sp.]|jgi:hypothetical protein|nr:hypothetical protein [Treponema sp.]
MKKTLIAGLAALFAVSALLVMGCEEVATTIDPNAIPSLAAPGNVKAAAHPGANLVTWDLVKDAAKYQVVRKDTTTGITTTVAELAADGYYVDIVGFANQLIDGHKYRYTIIAKSLTSPNRSIAEDGVIYNGSANSNEITATIPASSPVTAPNATVTVEKNVVVVQWTNATVPSFVDYEAEYTVSTPNGQYPFAAVSLVDGTRSNGEKSADKYFAPKQQITFPLTSGTSVSVTVKAKWQNGYYASVSGAAVTKDLPVSNALAAVSNGSAVRGTADKTKVTLTWSAVAGATGYDVYSAAYDGGATGSWALLGSVTGTTYEDTVPVLEGRRYAVVATNGTVARSGSATPFAVTGATLGNISSATVTRGAVDKTKVTLAWQAVTNATGYEVSSAAYDDGIGSWTLLGTTTVTTYEDTVPVLEGKKYSVVATNGAVRSEQVVSATLSPSYLSAPSINYLSGNDNTYILYWGVVSGATGYDVYRAPVKNGVLTSDYAFVESITAASYGVDHTAGEQWRYYVIATAGSITSILSAPQTLPSSVFTPGTVALSLSRTIDKDVKLTWNPIAAATGYEVQRAEFTGDRGTHYDGETIGLSAFNGPITWAPITTAPVFNGNSYTLVDATTDAAKHYVYAVYAVAGTEKSSAALKFAQSKDSLLGRLAITGFAVASSRSGTSADDKVTLTWNKNLDALAYVLEKREVDPAYSVATDAVYDYSSIVFTGAWTTVTAAQKEIDGTPITFEVKDTAPVDKAFVYRIRAVNDALGLTEAPYQYWGIAKVTGYIGSPTYIDDATEAGSTSQYLTYKLEVLKEKDAAYTLNRVVYADKDHDVVTETVVDAKANADADYAVFIDADGIDVLKDTEYVLTVEKNGITEDITTQAFGYATALNANWSIAPRPAEDTVYAIELSVSVSGRAGNEHGFYSADLTADVWRSETNAFGVPIGTGWTKIVTEELFESDSFSYEYLDTEVETGKYYQYYVDLYSTAVFGGTKFATVRQVIDSDGSTPVQPSTAYATISNNASPSLVLSGNENAATLTILTGNDYYPILKDAKLYLISASGDYEELGTIAYRAVGIPGSPTVAAVQANSYYVSLNAAALNKLRTLGSDTLYLRTESTSGEQKPQNTYQGVSGLHSTITTTAYSIVGSASAVSYSTLGGLSVPTQGIVELTNGAGNPTSWVVGVTVYYYDGGYRVLGTIAYNTTVKNESPSQAAISANTYYILLDSTAKAALYGTGSKTLCVGNSYTGDYAWTTGLVSF